MPFRVISSRSSCGRTSSSRVAVAVVVVILLLPVLLLLSSLSTSFSSLLLFLCSCLYYVVIVLCIMLISKITKVWVQSLYVLCMCVCVGTCAYLCLSMYACVRVCFSFLGYVNLTPDTTHKVNAEHSFARPTNFCLCPNIHLAIIIVHVDNTHSCM